jgi:hypothetical protein
MNSVVIFGITTLLILHLFLVGCNSQNPEQTSVSSISDEKTAYTTNIEFQPRGNGIVETVTDPVYGGTYSIRLEIPEDYTMGDAARISIPLENITLNDITVVSYWCFIDEGTPLNLDGTYWVPYITFEIDTDGKPGCDTWVIGGKGNVIQEPSVWFEISLEEEWLFHVPTTVADYTSPFPITSMGTLTQVKSAIGPDGKTPLSDYPVTGIKLAIGNWGPGGPTGPVIVYVDDLECNEKTLYK